MAWIAAENENHLVKPVRLFLPVLVLLACAGSLRAGPPPPVGKLGLPLGTFAVIEGIYHPSGMLSTLPGFEIHKVNGVKLNQLRHIPVDGSKLIDGKTYVLHGYEIGEWAGQPSLPTDEDFPSQIAFCFLTRFEVTSVEKVNGDPAAGARPVDPRVPLVSPDFPATIHPKPPLGALGLLLGTFAVIEVKAPKHPVMMENPFEVTEINGKRPAKPFQLTIKGLPPLKGDAHATLHGFEVGGWTNTPVLPESEQPRNAPQVQQPFQFFSTFVLTSPPKISN